jgi:FkbM family methyltransferase
MYPLLRFLGKQNWIRFGIRDRLVRRFCNPPTAPDKDFLVDFFDYKYRGNLRSYVDWRVFFYGAYSRQELEFCGQLLRRFTNPVVLDIGANVGHHSLFFSGLCGQVHAFEPNPELFGELKQKLSLNGIRNVFVHNVGVGERDEMLAYYAPTGSNKGTGSFVAAHSETNEMSKKLEVRNGDNYIASLQLDRVDFIKIDVEGFEKQVLLGLRHTIFRYHPVIIVEFSSTTKGNFSSAAEFMNLFPRGYKISSIRCNRPVGIFFNLPSCVLETFDYYAPQGDLLCCPPGRDI